jgi:5-oxoprolinase (ATP-hydrolysing)
MESNTGVLGFRFAIDRGGTFTDVYCEIHNTETDQKEIKIEKLLSVDPNHYNDAPTEGIRRILQNYLKRGFPRDQKIETSHIKSIRMGTTVATNALLERKGERTALFITKGFKDLLHIGNQSRPNIFDLVLSKPHKLYEKVVEVDERVLPSRKTDQENKEIYKGRDGTYYQVVTPLDIDKTREQLQQIKNEGFNSIAIVLMHSYAYPSHEDIVGEMAKEIGFKQVSRSADVMARQKIVKRGDTCTVDAYLNPHISRYLEGFKQGFDEKLTENVSLFFMQSDGGLSPMDTFRGSKAILSGPAGGVVGYAMTTNRILGKENKIPVIGFDMGGTSTDVSRFDSDYELIFETNIAGVSIQAPQLDINTVAAGGGSRLFFRKGLFVVGPESASADPGPVCYRKNGYLAVTDANLVLGRLLPEYFPKIFGKTEDQPLDKDATKVAFEALTTEINEFNKTLGSNELNIHEVANGFIRVANEAMSRPIRAITQARGINPKNHILSIFGGAGGQHGCAIAKNLGIKKVVIHKYCGILSAYGMGLANVIEEREEPHSSEYSQDEVLNIKNSHFPRLLQKNNEELEKLGFADDKIEHSKLQQI